MLKIGENAFRDHLFEHHKDDLASLIVGRREPVAWADGETFPPIRFLLQQRAERAINEMLDNLVTVVLTAKELRLERGEVNATRVDLFGTGEETGITLIELKKSGQTERQAFTELLAYANHFCSIFPGLTESAITTVLVAPMETRTVRDAYAQELVGNRKNIVALIPHEDEVGAFTLGVYYPDASYYEWIENNVMNDHSMTCVTLSFPIIQGWIDSDVETNGSIPSHSKSALNTVANSIAHHLEANGFHALVYANQKWGNFPFPYLNCIVAVAMNPFSSARTAVDDGVIFGRSASGRLEQVQAIFDQLTDDGRDLHWLEAMEGDFQGRLIRAVTEQFDLCFLSQKMTIDREIGLPDWYGLKVGIVDAVCTHNLNVYTTGLIREIYQEYQEHVYGQGYDTIHGADDLHMFLYGRLHPFFDVWQILSGLGYEPEEDRAEND